LRESRHVTLGQVAWGELGEEGGAKQSTKPVRKERNAEGKGPFRGSAKNKKFEGASRLNLCRESPAGVRRILEGRDLHTLIEKQVQTKGRLVTSYGGNAEGTFRRTNIKNHVQAGTEKESLKGLMYPPLELEPRLKELPAKIGRKKGSRPEGK